MANTAEADKKHVKELEEKKLQLAAQLAALRAEARQLDLKLHAAGANPHIISCW